MQATRAFFCYRLQSSSYSHVYHRAHLHHDQGRPQHDVAIAQLTQPPAQPDGVQRNLVGKIITRFEERGFKLIALKLVHATEEHLEKRMSSR